MVSADSPSSGGSLSGTSSGDSTSIPSGIGLLREVSTLITDMGWKGLGQSIIGTVVLANVFLGINLLEALFSVPISLLEMVARVVPGLNEALLMAPVRFVEAAISAGAAAFGGGWTSLLGPFQGPFGVALGLIMFWELLYFLDYVDSDFFGVVADIPDWFMNNDESTAASDDDGGN